MKFLLSFVTALICCGSCLAQNPTATLNIKGLTVKAEVVDNDASREKGLMYRKELGRNNGMLFIFQSEKQVCMWMRNTFIPLSVAFMDKSGTIVNIEKMQPLSEQIHCSVKPVTYALEMNQGWFEKNRITSGDIVRRLPRAK